MKKKVRLVLIVLVVLVGAGVAWRLTSQRNRHADRIRVSGNMEVSEVELSFRIPGWVAARVVDEGMAVNAGDEVARLDATELTHEVELRKREVAAAQAFLGDIVYTSPRLPGRQRTRNRRDQAVSVIAPKAAKVAVGFSRHVGGTRL